MATPSRRSQSFAASLLAPLMVCVVAAQAPVPPQPSRGAAAEERGPQRLAPETIQSAIDALGTVDVAATGTAFDTRMNASRTLRRGVPDAVVPALIRAVESHSNQYVRFRALVLLTGFNDTRTPPLMREMIANPNDRLRTLAYGYFEHHPAADMIPALLKALDREESEFVRPALVRALAAQASDPRVRETLLLEVGRGQDFFRSAVVAALGDYHATYAEEPLLQIARLGGPLQIDAVIALGKLKDQRAMETLASLQRTAPRETQPVVAAAICLIGINCEAHIGYLIDTLKFAEKNSGYQALLRNTVAGIVALASSGNEQITQVLFEVGAASSDPPRAPMALGAGTIAIRNAPLMLSFLERTTNRPGAIELVAEGFDMLEEDYEEESFFATVRRGYWQAPADSATRRVGQALIDKLQF
jgi:HEAT repeat protein